MGEKNHSTAEEKHDDYPLVNIQKTMENHNF